MRYGIDPPLEIVNKCLYIFLQIRTAMPHPDWNQPRLTDAPTATTAGRLAGLTRGMFGESAVWDDRQAGIWWVDMHGHALILSLADGRSRLWKTPGPELPNARAVLLHRDGGVVVALNDRLARFDPAAGAFAPIDLSVTLPAGHYYNDAVVDPAGRILIGTMAPGRGNDGAAVIYQIDGDRQVRVLIDGINTSNGLAFSPDGRTLYWSDSWQAVRRIWRADYDPYTGAMGEGRPFVDFAHLPGRPDGAAMDRDGGYWIVGMGSPWLHRFTPDGRLSVSLELPIDTPTRPAFGGGALDRLYLATGGLKAGEFDDGLKGGLLDLGPAGHIGCAPWAAAI
jgi:sugar lactone lactonase YvrE